MSYTSFDFPHTHFYDDDLRELIKKVFDMSVEVKNFVSVNAIKYANPIQWNITSQYEKNTIVIDPLTGTAYISVAPVPSGVALTREEFWTVVFDLGQFVVRASKNFSNRYEQETTLTATFATSAGQWLVWGDTLYVANVNITPGDSYVVDGNIRHITVEEVINAITENIGELTNLTTADKSNVVNAINEINSNIGDLTNLATTDKSNAVNAINEIDSNVGNLANLATTDKTSAVNAINEVKQDATDIDTKVGDLVDLNTTDKTSVVNAINEINSEIQSIDPLEWINVKSYGAIGDGVTDDTAAINSAIAELNTRDRGALYFPSGTYYISDALTAITAKNFDIFGAGKGSTCLESHITNGSNVFTVGGFNIHGYSIHDFEFKGVSSNEVWIYHTYGNYGTIHDIKLTNINSLITVGDGENPSIVLTLYNIYGMCRGDCITHNGNFSGLFIHDCDIDNYPQHTATFLNNQATSGTFDTICIFNCAIVGWAYGVAVLTDNNTTKSNVFIYDNIFDVISDRSIIIGASGTGKFLRPYINNNWLTASNGSCIAIGGTSTNKIAQIEVTNNKFLEANNEALNISHAKGVIVSGNQFVTFNKANNGSPALTVQNSEHILINDNIISNLENIGTNAVAMLLYTNDKLIVSNNDCLTFTSPTVFTGNTNVIANANLGITDQVI